MALEGSNGVLEKILIGVGRIEGRCDGIEQRLDRIDARLDLGAAQMRDLGTASAHHDERIRELSCCADKAQRSISALHKQVGYVENTGTHHLVEERTRWITLRTLGAIALALFGALGGTALLSSARCNQSKAEQVGYSVSDGGAREQ